MIYEIANTEQVSVLFSGREESMIQSCLQRIMGKIYSNEFNFPLSAMAVLGDFIFFVGKPCEELVYYRPDCYKKNSTIMIPPNDEWKNLIVRSYKNRAKTVFRYATEKDPNAFDKEKLKKTVHSLPFGYELRRINNILYDKCMSEPWSRDLVSQFESYERYKRLGLGYVVLKDNVIISGASSYSRYKTGIEIQIDTQIEHRQEGLAYICGSKLIYECLRRNLYPSWDAQNKASLSLALKLGYKFSHRYTAIEISDY